MTALEPMPSVRRRPIPGMTSQPVTATPSPPPHPEPTVPAQNTPSGRQAAEPELTDDVVVAAQGSAEEPGEGPVSPLTTVGGASPRRRAANYAATRLANFRIPVDLHDRYRRLVREAEERHPRLRRPSLTEVIIALLEEGPQTADETAELIRRKRAAEHEADR